MKKQLLKSAATVVLGMGLLAGSAMAVPTTWVDVQDPTDVKVPPSYTVTHDISDPASGSFHGNWFTDGNDTIESFSFEIALYDDNVGTTERKIVGWRWGFPVYRNVDVPDGSESGRVWNVNLGMGNNTILGTPETMFAASADIWWDGRIDLTISATNGDFYFDKSTLTVRGDNGTAPVPEPTTMLLFGTGLAGLAAVGRRRKATMA